MRDVGISDDFIRDVREQVTPGTSALFALTSGAVQDKVADEFRGLMYVHSILISIRRDGSGRR
jgi:uncharacterized membrane protein